MTMISRKDFTSSDYRLFMLPAFTRAFLFKSSPLGELSYNTKNRGQICPRFKYTLLTFNSTGSNTFDNVFLTC